MLKAHGVKSIGIEGIITAIIRSDENNNRIDGLIDFYYDEVVSDFDKDLDQLFCSLDIDKDKAKKLKRKIEEQSLSAAMSVGLELYRRGLIDACSMTGAVIDEEKVFSYLLNAELRESN